MDAVESVLKQLGLRQRERQVYRLLLTVGTTPASTVSRRANMNRSTAQYTCQQLAKRGLARIIKRNATFLYTPEPPEKLMMILEEQRRDIDRKEQEVGRVMGELKQMMQPQSILPRVEFFEGREGIVKAYDLLLDDLEEGTEVLSYAKPLEPEEDDDDIVSITEKFVAGRIAKRVSMRIITAQSPYTEDFRYRDADALRETRFVSPDQFDFAPAQILLYRDTMFSVNIARDFLFAYIMQNASIVKIHQSVFELAWRQADA